MNNKGLESWTPEKTDDYFGVYRATDKHVIYEARAAFWRINDRPNHPETMHSYIGFTDYANSVLKEAYKRMAEQLRLELFK